MEKEKKAKTVAEVMASDNDVKEDISDAKANRFWGIICYLWWLCLLPLVAKRESPFIQHHAINGVVLSIVQSLWILIYYIVVGVSLLIFREKWTVTYLISAILSFVTLMLYLVSVLGIMRVLQCSKKDIPLVNNSKKIINKIRKKVIK